MINYDLIRTYHRIDAILSMEETARRLREVSSYATNSPRYRAITKVMTKKSGMSKTEADVLKDFPEHGINIGMWSNSLLFADNLCHMSVARHKAIVSLMKMGKLAIVEGYRVESIGAGQFVRAPEMKMEQIIVKVAE